MCGLYLTLVTLQGSIKSEMHCAAIRSALFSSCHAAVPPQFYFKACRIDMCECPGTQCHCEVRNIIT